MAYESDVRHQVNALNDSARNARNERNRINSLVDCESVVERQRR
jgi:hypothetical protein